MSLDSLDLQNQFLERLIKENYELFEALKESLALLDAYTFGKEGIAREHFYRLSEVVSKSEVAKE